MPRISRILSTLLLTALSAAPAIADECAPIVAAFGKLAEVPAYRQVATIAGQNSTEIIAIGDTLYVKSGGADWTAVQLQPGGRKQNMDAMIGGKDGIKDCRSESGEPLDGKAMTVHSYAPPPMGGLNAGRQKVWIGEADGLPYQMETVDGKTRVAISFDGIAAPK